MENSSGGLIQGGFGQAAQAHGAFDGFARVVLVLPRAGRLPKAKNGGWLELRLAIRRFGECI